ncbi:MAG TPA: polyphosphate glucokinase [Bacteroidales bacterium]|jgi:polyphosphate glucokinase|nr:polyphosphate glucokinase [Bacteroidales bacterium]
MKTLGIDIGGSAIKGAVVNTATGEITVKRYRIETTQLASVNETVDIVKQIVNHFHWKGKIGFGFPAVVQNGVVKTASNIDKAFIGINANKLFKKATGCKVSVLNDADVAGYAELTFGKVSRFKGVAIFLTIGTGIGSALFNKGKLIPNTELGHIFMNHGLKAEDFASDAVRKSEDLDWAEWGIRFNDYLLYLETLFYPDMFILGGGASKQYAKFRKQLTISTPVSPAKLLNDAGIIGAALLA